MGRKRKTRWRRLSIGEISANEDEDGELGVAVISLTRSHSASQNHSPARHPSDKPLSAVITMTNNNKDSSSSSPSLHTSSTNLSSAPRGGGDNNGGGPNGSGSGSKLLSGSSSSTPPAIPDKSQIPSQNASPCSSSSPNPHSQTNNSSGYHNGHNHVPSSYNNSTHPPPNSVSSNESTSSSTGGGGAGGGGHYNDRYHYTRENYRPPHHHHHHHHHNHHSHHNSSYNGPSSSSQYQGSGEAGSSSSRGERGGSYHYSGHPHSHKEYQNGYHGPGHYSGYQGNTYYRNSHNNYRNSHYSGGGGSSSGGGTGTGGEPYNGGESEGYHYPPSSRPYGGRFRKSRSYPASSYYYANGSSKSSGGASNSDNINRPSYNQDEYTKITTPRQDVLFKKGYLSQKKTQPSSSSVDSASAATTPSASTNGTPDTQSTNGINSDNSEGYENGETDYVIPYDDTIYYAPAPPPEAVFTDPNTGQVYYGHCSSTGEYYDAYPVSPVMVAAGYPPVYYPMMPYAPGLCDWNGVQAPMYPMVAAPPPPHQLPTEETPLLSPGLQGLESSPATTTNPNTNSDPSADPSSNQSSAVSNNATSTNATAPPTSSTTSERGRAHDHHDDGEEECDDTCPNKEGLGSDSGLDSGSSVGDDAVSSSAATSQGNSSGAEEECVGGINTSGAKVMGEEETPKNNVRSKKQHLKQGTPTTPNNNNNNGEGVGKKSNVESGASGNGKAEDNNNEGGRKVNKLAQDVEKLHLSKRKDEYSSSESVLSSASSTDSGKASPPTIKGVEQDHEDDTGKRTTPMVDPTTSALSPSNNTVSYNNSNAQMKGITAMVFSSQHHPQHLTPTTAIPYNTIGGPHPQGIPVGAPVMTTLPMQVGCPPVMIAAPNGMPLPPLVSATPIHHMAHPPPPPGQNGGPPGHHPAHPHYHGGHPNHGQHPHHPHNNHHPMHHHPSSHHPSQHPHQPPHHHNHQQHPSHGPPPPVYHTNYSHHHNHHHNPRHHGPHNHPSHQISPGQHHQPHHQLAPPPPPPLSQSPNSQTTIQAQQQQPPPQAVTLGSAGPPPPPGSTPYHVYPHPTAYVYGPPVYNDEGSAAATNGIVNISTTATDTCANLENTASTTNTTTTTNNATTFTVKKQSRDSKGERKTPTTTAPTKEKGDKTRSTATERKQDNNETGDDGESKSISTALETPKELAAYRAEGTESTRVTASEGEVKKQSCDLKLENIIASKEFNPEKTSPTAAAQSDEQGAAEVKLGKGKSGELLTSTTTATTSASSTSSPPPPNSYSAEATEKGELVVAAVSLTLESPSKMNKEIEIRPLKLDMSGADGEDEKVGSPSSPLPPQPPNLGESESVGAEVRNSTLKDAASVLTSSFPTSSSTSASSSSPSSANESSTSSPVNDGGSLMRSQSKLAARKKFSSEEANPVENGIGESCNLERSKPSQSNNYNSKKKQRKNSASGVPSSSSSNQGNHHNSNSKNDDNETKPETKMPPNLSESDHRKSRKGKQDQPHQQKPLDNNDEENKTSSTPADETCQEGGQESQNQMTSSNESGQLPRESCTSSSTTVTTTTTPQQESGESESINMASGSCGSGDALSSSSSSVASRKPADLTVQCPISSPNDDDVQYETLQLQRSPLLANEPSSPDSLNTNQSVAGSEFAPGENLSMSESDFMNRTTSIDEIEEDLPHEVELPTMGSEPPAMAVAAPFANAITTTNISNEEALDDNSAKNPESPLSSSQPAAALATSVGLETIPTIISEPSSMAEPPTNVGQDLEDPSSNEKAESSKDNDETTARVVTAEEAIKSNTTTASPKATPSPASPNSEDNSVEKAGEEKVSEVPSRPQSITLAVTEWLKTQGDDALTPIIARASSSDEFEGDGEETTDSDDEEFDDDDDHVQESQGSGKKRDDKASNLEQNQKNVYGNPWAVAPSNKSGSSIGKVTRRRSGSKKSAMKATEKEGSGMITTFPKSDGVCSRVAPHLSSNKLSTSSTTTTPSVSVDSSSNKNYKTNCIINNNKYLTAQTSTCSASTSDDQDENYLTDNYKEVTTTARKKDKHNSMNSSSSGLLTNSKGYLETTAKSRDTEKSQASRVIGTGKDYDSGLELSSPENSSSSESTKSNNAPLTSSQTGNGTIINHKSNMSDSPVYPPPAPISTLIMEHNNNDKKWEHSSTPTLHLDHNKYINTDQVVIAAPLTIVETHSTKGPSCSHKKTGNINENERKESESSLPSSSSRPPLSLPNNNGDPTSLESGGNNGDAQSPGSAPSSFTSIEDRDHAEICDPQRYAKYYQFGVVFDASDDPDQGIDTAGEDEEEIDFLHDITLLDSPTLSSISSTPTNSAEKDHAGDKREQRLPHLHHNHQHPQQQKNADDFLAIMMQRNRKLARKTKKSVGAGGDDTAPDQQGKKREKYNNGDVLVSKSVYLQDQEDEEIGTFDPKAVLESRMRRASFGPGPFLPSPTNADNDDCNNAEDALDYAGDPTTLVAVSPSTSADPHPPFSQQPHLNLYVNPLSLAAELSGSEMVKVGMSSGNNKGMKKLRDYEDDSSSLDSSSSSTTFAEEPPLPPYESPPSVEIPVYNATTPAARVIRPNFYAIGDPVSGAICCSIQ